MKQPRSAHLLPALALAWLLALWPAPRPAAACSPPPQPTPWFIPAIDAAPAALPAGVEIRKHTAETIAITNTGATPLYVISAIDLNGVGQYPPLGVALPPERGAEYRLRDGTYLQWAWDLEDMENEDRGLAWRKPRYGGAVFELGAAWTFLTSRRGGKTVPLEINERTGDNRPDDAPPPAAHPAELTLVYGERVLTVPVTISYHLNPDYEPGSAARYRDFGGCGSPEDFVALGGGLGLAALLAVLGRQLLRARRRSGERA